MMRTRPSHPPVRALLLGALLAVTFFAACEDGPTEPPPDPPRVTTITVSPATADLAVAGSTVRLTVQVLDENGQPTTGVEIVWAVDDTAVAVVDASGLVTGIVDGTATVTATVGGVTGAATVRVAMGSAATDRAALVALYHATGGQGWRDNTNWLTDAPLGEWYGVSTDASGRVVTLDLSGYYDSDARQTVRHGLTGEIPAELGGLASLDTLDLSRNQLSGNIPTELGEPASLRWLSLWGNQLSGNIPAELGELASLRWLSLSSNQLSGNIPIELGGLASLERLYLSDNQLSGNIPAELGELASLQILWLHRNQLSGNIPAGLGGLASLRDLALSSNQLSGGVPAGLGGLASLERLWLGGNQLSGNIPAELGGLANLTLLSLSSNQLSGNIPAELGRLASLERLYLYNNFGLAGALPLALASLSALERFWYEGTGLCVPDDASFRAWLNAIQDHQGTDVDCAERDILEALYHATGGPSWRDNTNWLTDAPLGEWYGVSTDASGRVVSIDLSGYYDSDAQQTVRHGLTGEIPAELGGLPSLDTLDLSYNQLSGNIPAELGGLASLERLSLWGNQLSGNIPAELGGLANLKTLSLFSNALTGAIPPELGNLASLERLYLASNQLSGNIPAELGGFANLETLWLYGNELTGAIPPELGNLANLERLDLSHNGLTGAIPPELGNLANLERLDLSHNGLTGAIPPELGNLANLERLDLSHNGLIPRDVGNLANLAELDLHDNALSGAIPPELGNLSNLKVLYLHDNALSGAIPATFVKLPLSRFDWARQTLEWDSGLCAPGTSVVVGWLDGVDEWSGPFCNASDRAVLAGLYESASGGDWTESTGWLDGPALAEWHGVETDSLGRVTALDVSDNGLSGGLPGSIGDLGRLARLRIGGNELDGRLPLSLSRLDLLREFHYDGTRLCEPADARFRAWLAGIPSRRGTGVRCAPPTDRDVLVALYDGTGGPGWTNGNGWLTEAPLGEWYGVDTDASGRVVRLDLSGNELTGAIPPELGNLAGLLELELSHNALSGAIPPELGNLANLLGLYLGRNALSGAIPPTLGNLANLQVLSLWRNALSGAIPTELGNLANLVELPLFYNALSGAIPAELGNLASLEALYLSRNDLTGAIPPELGNLANLELLGLGENDLTGAIPAELGNLANLELLGLGENDLTGAIPAELGNLANLEGLYLNSNDLSGAIPATFGGLADLIELDLSHNGGLAGALPAGLIDLALKSLLAGGTDLCVPPGPAFEEWLSAIPHRRIALCREPPAAYLVQAVQSRAHPVPLVAGEDALLRVFVTAAKETAERMPEVRARFYLNGTERHVADIPGSSTPIPTEIDEGGLSKSANAVIPGRIVRPGLEMVVEIDPGGALDRALGVPGRIPEEGRLVVEVREMPTLDLTVIPFLWSSEPDSAIIGLAEGMAAGPETHALLEDTRVLLPVGDLEVTAHAPVVSTSNNAYDLLHQTRAIRVLEGGGGHYMGMMSGSVTGAGGVAWIPGRSNFSRPSSGVIAHELGHNMSLQHAPCGGVRSRDPAFPYPNGSIGAWGYDFRRASLVPAVWKDHMSYCDPAWTSDYHFAKALRHRLDDESASAAALAAGPVRSLLLWGGVDAAGTPFLHPAFVADAPPTLPDSAGDYAVTGLDASGRELFSLSFAMPVAMSEDGEVSSFVFALPTRPGWADALASVTLSGPAGTTTLDGDSDMPMAILRDPVTGWVRGFLRDVVDPAAVQAAAGARARGAGSLNVLFSSGIPRAAAWRN